MPVTRPSASLVVASLALATSLGGVSYAAVKIPKGSVGTKQLKSGAVTAAKIKDGQVTGSDVKDGSLTGADVDVSTLALSDQSAVVTIPAVEFNPDNTTSGARFYSGADATIYQVEAGADYQAQVPLPDGASITAITVFVYDVAPGNLTASLLKITPSAGIPPTQIASGSSSSLNGNGSFVIQPPESNTFPSDSTAAVIKLSFGSTTNDLQLKGVRVDYDFDATLTTH